MPTLSSNGRMAAFISNDSGAVTVDWVVLTAALVGLGLASMAVVSTGVEDLSDSISTQLASVELTDRFEAGSGGAQPYEGQWLAPGAYDSDLAWVQALSDESIQGIMSNYASYSDPSNVNMGTHNEPRNHDQYWMAYNEAIDRGLEVPATGV